MQLLAFLATVFLLFGSVFTLLGFIADEAEWVGLGFPILVIGIVCVIGPHVYSMVQYLMGL